MASPIVKPASRPADAARLVLVDADLAARARLAGWLTARGIDVRISDDVPTAVDALRRHGADAVVLATPLGNADWIAATAALTEGDFAPALIVIDATGQAGELLRILPHDRAPGVVLPRSVAPATVLVALAELLGGRARASLPAPNLAELLVGMHALGETGVLELRADDIATRILLREGQPVFAEGGTLRETLGRLLLRRGALSESDYIRVIERMTERLIENEATRMGEVLVELGLLSTQEVFEALSEQVREKILACFRWERFDHHFEPRDALPDDVLAYRCPPVEALVLAGLRAHFDASRVDALLAPVAGGRPRLRGAPDAIAARFHATPAEQRVLRELDGVRTIAALRETSPLGELATGRVLASLWIADAIELASGAATASRAPEPARERVAAPAPVVPRPPRRAAEPAHPAPPSPSPLARLRSKLARPKPQPRATPDARTAALEAERLFRQGLRLLEQPALPGAQRAFSRACALRPKEPEYALLAAWVETQLAKDPTARAAARERAAAHARQLLKQDPDSVRAHTIAGQIAITTGDLDTAERHLRHALRVDATHPDALRATRALDRRRAER
jgi:tetratricopeptide (TPR) repeat protein